MVSDRIIVDVQDDEGLDLVAGDNVADLAGPWAGKRTGSDAGTCARGRHLHRIAGGQPGLRWCATVDGTRDAFGERGGRGSKICGHDFLLRLKEFLHRLLEREHCVLVGQWKLGLGFGEFIEEMRTRRDQAACSEIALPGHQTAARRGQRPGRVVDLHRGVATIRCGCG